MSEREEYTPTTDEVRNNMALGVAVAQACADDGHPDLPQNIDWPMGSARPAAKKQFDSWLSAHERALRENIARAIEDRREHFIAETTLTLGGLPAWTDAYLNGLDDAIDVARGEEQTDE